MFWLIRNKLINILSPLSPTAFCSILAFRFKYKKAWFLVIVTRMEQLIHARFMEIIWLMTILKFELT